MNAEDLRDLLEGVRAGLLTPAQAQERLAHLPYADLGFARVDHHRTLRLAMPEVVFGEGKSAEQISRIAQEIAEKHGRVLVTRVEAEKARQVRDAWAEPVYDPISRTLRCTRTEPPCRTCDPVAVVTAGTSDLPVAEEAVQTLEVAGVRALRVYDAGVAGLHRLFADLPRLASAPAVIVVAGMEGALPSVIGGLVGCPVVAVPTSVGYGVALGGLTALFGMLTSCASGIAVVNIDNGFGAAMAVLRIVNQLGRKEQT